MTQEFTGDGVSFVSANTAPIYHEYTKTEDYRCTGYDVPRESSAMERAACQAQPKATKAAIDVPRVRSVDQRAVRQILLRARKHAELMVEKCHDKDILELANEGVGLSRDLDQLWAKREVKSEEWAMALIFLQSSIAKEEFECFTLDQCRAVLRVVGEYLCNEVASNDEVRQVRRTLREGGFDPWKAISQMKGE